MLLVSALLALSAGSPGQWYLPEIQVNLYRWPQAGFTVMGAFRDRIPVLYGQDSPPMWFADWWLGCEMYSANGEVYGRGRVLRGD